MNEEQEAQHTREDSEICLSRETIKVHRQIKTMFKNSGSKIRPQQFLKKEFRLLARQCPTIRFVYSLRSNCWDLSAENENAQIKEFQCYDIEADTILLLTAWKE